MIPETGIRADFKQTVLTVVETAKCVNCGDPVVVYVHAVEGGVYWCKRCTVDIKITSTPVTARVMRFRFAIPGQHDT